MIEKDRIKRLDTVCLDMKLKALEMAHSTGNNGAHIGGAFSTIEILAALYDVARITDTTAPERDRIIVSKGHCVLALYTALWKKGLLTDSDLATFDTDGTELYGHPHRCLEKGIEFSGGSLGLGVSYAVGVAKACKIRGLGNRIYVLLGDGECNEGIVWEALMSIPALGLDNVTVIIDNNAYQLDGPTAQVMDMQSLPEKLRSFGFGVTEIDGHSLPALVDALSSIAQNKPSAIVAKTIKAHGISFLENNKLSHQCALNKKKYEKAKEEIIAAYGV